MKTPSPVDKSLVRDRLKSAKRRLDEFIVLWPNIGALTLERQQLTQEFFFHAVAAIEMTAQLVKQARTLGKQTDFGNPRSIGRNLPIGDAIRAMLLCSYAYPKREPMPIDPYSDAGMIWRLWNYRHQVSHRGRNPFAFSMTSASLFLDPRDPAKVPSKRTVRNELQEMYALVEGRCEAILALLP
jgi:hypothetical protein